MKIIVQKFGGTSVANEESRLAVKNKIQQAIHNGYSPVVVVSAMGRKGAPYATDTLIDVLKEENISVNVRELDVMMCCGEIISSCIMAAHLQKHGINAMALTGGQAGIITDSQFGAARIKNINVSNLHHLLELNQAINSIQIDELIINIINYLSFFKNSNYLFLQHPKKKFLTFLVLERLSCSFFSSISCIFLLASAILDMIFTSNLVIPKYNFIYHNI